MIYLESSALVKLVTDERESTALKDFVDASPQAITSDLTKVEVVRAVKRAGTISGLRESADEVLAGVSFITIDEALLKSAAELEPPTLRSLDAIHLASALSVRNDLEALITYDRRLQMAAAEHGLEVIAPA